MPKDVSRLITKALRHKPELLDLKIDKQGYCSVDGLIKSLKNKGYQVDKSTIELIGENERFSFNENHTKIRADYGNSIGLKLADMYGTNDKPPSVLYHGTSLEALDGIKEKGIIRYGANGNKARDHIFLTENVDVAKRKGARHGRSIVLPIDAVTMHDDGYLFYHAKLDIWLTEHIPSRYIFIGNIIY